MKTMLRNNARNARILDREAEAREEREERREARRQKACACAMHADKSMRTREEEDTR